MSYEAKPVKAPRLAGFFLKVFVAIVESRFGGPLRKMMLKNLGVPEFRKLHLDEAPTPWSFRPLPKDAFTGEEPDLNALISTPTPNEAFPEEPVSAFLEAYRSGRLSPIEVAERVLKATSASNAASPPLRAIIAQDRDDLIRQAEASQKRWAEGAPLSLLDGVPVAVKDEIDQVPYGTSAGTSFLGKDAVKRDSSAVERLRATGALLIGKANMTEIGIVVTGLNPHHGAVRNPYDPTRMTGGSSSGSAGSVAYGLCPVAVGADGGGSIRMPASFCGLVGLKPTFGRVSEYGAAPLCWSVAHIGPLATTARDAALLYSVLAGPDARDSHTLAQPPPTLKGLGSDDLSALRVGVYRPYFEDAEPEVVEHCNATLDRLTAAGMQRVEVEIEGIAEMRLAQVVTIASEMVAAHRRYHAEDPSRYGYDVRLNFALVQALDAADYVNAQRIRARASAHFAKLFEKVDLIALPTSGTVAPLAPLDALTTGESDLALLDRIMRFAGIANLTGHPAISFPAGYTRAGLPVGFQLIAPPWHEHRLLQVAQAAERLVEKKAPKIRTRLLS